MNLIALGCSLMDIYGMKEHLSDVTHRKLINLSHRASSNGLQIKRFKEYILNNTFLEDDIILWEITSYTRIPLRVLKTEDTYRHAIDVQMKHQLISVKKHFVFSNNNIFDKEPRLDFLCHSPVITNDMYLSHDYNDALQDLLATLILAKKMHSKLLVFFGWRHVMENHSMKKFKEVLDNHNIDYLNECYLDWAIDKKLSMYDDKHPTAESSIKFCKEIIIPKLNNLGWLNNL